MCGLGKVQARLHAGGDRAGPPATSIAIHDLLRDPRGPRGPGHASGTPKGVLVQIAMAKGDRPWFTLPDMPWPGDAACAIPALRGNATPWRSGRRRLTQKRKRPFMSRDAAIANVT